MMLDNNDQFKSSIEEQNYFLNEVEAVTKTGVYSINLKEDQFFIDTIGRSILGISTDCVLSLAQASHLFSTSSTVKTLLQTCLKGDYFKQDLEMQSFEKEKVWVHLTGKPRYNNKREVVGIRGVFMSIDKYVRDNQEVQRHTRIIEAQNERLLHFAHIVSHNLRSHSSNLELTLDLFKDVVEDERTKVFYSYLNEVSQNLSTTLKHLNQVVTASAQNSSSVSIDLSQAVQKVLDRHQKALEEIDAIVKIDFSAFDCIEYVPSFFEDTLETFVSNSIKHRSSDRKLVLQICTKTVKDKKLFEFKDNGSGIDLERDESKIFRVYKDSKTKGQTKGLSLFLAKNQIEALGGDLVVKSTLGQQTTFIIKF